MITKQLNQVSQRAAEGRGRNCRITPQAEIARLKLIAKPQAEIVTLCHCRRYFEETAVGFELKFQCR